MDEPDPDKWRDALKARAMETPLHQLLGFRFVESDDGSFVVEMPVDEAALNQTGNLHGGAIATLIDVVGGSTAARASAFQPGENTLVTADLHVRYLGRPRGDWVRGKGTVLHAGRSLIVVEVKVTDPEGRVIASADFSSMVVSLRQPLRPSAEADVRAPDL
ncbi:MAG: PaaI family thioesterase [Acidimicrobiia bacterium]